MTWKKCFTRIYDIRSSVRPPLIRLSVRPPLIRPSVSAFYPNPLCFSALCYQLELQTNEIGLLKVHVGKVKPEVKLRCFRIIYSVGNHGSKMQMYR